MIGVGKVNPLEAETADESLVPIRWRPADAVHIPHLWNCNRKKPVQPALDYTQPTAQVRPGYSNGRGRRLTVEFLQWRESEYRRPRRAQTRIIRSVLTVS